MKKTTTGDAVLDIILGDEPGGDFVQAIEDPTADFLREQQFGKIESTLALDKSWDEPLGVVTAPQRRDSMQKVVRSETRIVDNDRWVFAYDSAGELVDARVVMFSTE
jgi:hypothetical protein